LNRNKRDEKSMNAETLERLMIDRELGGLSDDAAALLDAWLADHPDVAPAAESLYDVIALARRALPPTAAEMPPAWNPSNADDDAARRSPAPISTRPVRAWPMLQRFAALAACLTIGAFVGARFAGPARDRATSTGLNHGATAVRLVGTSPIHDASADAHADAGDEFWSLDRARRRRAERPSRDRSDTTLRENWTRAAFGGRS
jgi:hypothetical protein